VEIGLGNDTKLSGDWSTPSACNADGSAKAAASSPVSYFSGLVVCNAGLPVGDSPAARLQEPLAMQASGAQARNVWGIGGHKAHEAISLEARRLAKWRRFQR